MEAGDRENSGREVCLYVWWIFVPCFKRAFHFITFYSQYKNITLHSTDRMVLVVAAKVWNLIFLQGPLLQQLLLLSFQTILKSLENIASSRYLDIPFVVTEINKEQSVVLYSRASNEGSRKFHNHGEGTYYDICVGIQFHVYLPLVNPSFS